ncbi:MAG: hypothetical protein ACYCX4_11080 [Bacillota bacterium]
MQIAVSLFDMGLDIAIPSQQGTFLINLPEGFSLSKTIQEAQGEKQKISDQGQPLFKTNISENGLTWEETTEAKMPVRFEQQEVTNRWADENGVEHTETVTVQVPVEWVENEPLLISNIVQRFVSFIENPHVFNVDEIIQEKYRRILDSSAYSHIYGDEVLTDEDIDNTVPGHSANTGVKVLELLQGGQAQTNPIILDVAASNFGLYLEADPGVVVDISPDGQAWVTFENGIATLPAVTQTIVIRWRGPADKKANVCAYGILY